MVAETRLDPAQLVLPLFVREGIDVPLPIASMPGVVNHSRESLIEAAQVAAQVGVGGVMLFGVPSERDAVGSGATDPDGILNSAVRDVVEAVGSDLVVMADLCLDEFTDHGHCGVLAPDGSIDNDATLERYGAMGVALADAGAHVVGTSGMMDGQVGAVRAALDAADHQDTVILAYAAKYASALYGPFREAVDSALTGDRRTYQQDPANGRESLRELSLDLAEGADIVMVKPAGTSLDVIAEAAALSDVPVAAYQVSGRVRDGRGRRGAGLDRPRADDPRDDHGDPARGRGPGAHVLGRRGRGLAGRRVRRQACVATSDDLAELSADSAPYLAGFDTVCGGIPRVSSGLVAQPARPGAAAREDEAA